MKQDCKAYYGTLGLNPGASPEEVKKAYFRMVRKYSPEKDPDQFQKIREAYEAIKDGPPPERVEYPLPKDPAALFYLKEGDEWYRVEDYAYAAKQYLKALDEEPDNPFVLWQLSCALMDNENWQKAAKYLEQLARLSPDDREVFSMLANAYHNRGWHKKALPVFQRAYDMGDRNCKFLNGFASTRKENQEAMAAARLYWEAIQNYKPEDTEPGFAFDAFYGYAETADFSKSGAVEYLDTYTAFIKKHRRRVDDAEEALSPIFAFLKNYPKLLKHRDIFTRICSALDQAAGYGEEWIHYGDILRSLLLEKALENDPRSLHPDWRLFTHLPHEDTKQDEQLVRYAMLDNMLCVIDDWDQLKDETDIIRADYPMLIHGYETYFDQLAAGQKEELFDKLKWEFDKLSAKYEGAEYLKRHPEQKEKKPQYISKDDDFRPYVRSGEKVGRNDPCPCGSGKKFKKCCMGKGIYD